MKIRIRNKILITICSLILAALAAQIVFNLFFSKGFFLYQPKDIITAAYNEIQSKYSSDLTGINDIGAHLQDTYGIKTVISDEGVIVYASGYAFFNQGPMFQGSNSLNIKIFQNIEFLTEPSVKLIETPALAMQGEGEQLRLGGKFEYEGREVLVLLTLKVDSIENSVSVFTEADICISLAVLTVVY